MKPINDVFFYQATLRICGSLNIETMMHNCLDFIRHFIPADCIGLHIYDLETHIFEDFSFVGEAGIDNSKVILKLDRDAVDYVNTLRDKDPLHPDFITNNPANDPVAKIFWEADRHPVVSYISSLLEVGDNKIGIVSLLSKGYNRYAVKDLKLLNQLNGPFTISLSNALKHRELKRLKEMLADDNRYLNRQLYQLTGDEIIGQHFGLREVMEMVKQVAPLSSQVLLFGETGTGKEVIANAIHYSSPRADAPFIKVNCGAIPDSLIDSELFGHEKGAFTGALKQKRGRFERAHGGTLFLDEIGELPLGAQVRLLRVIQTREIERIGGTEPVPVDIRIIAATHRNLEEMVSRGKFREDLWFRLNVFPITIPPLRYRTDDIPALVSFFIEKKTREMNLSNGKNPAPGAMEALQAYSWPGNVRELENMVERALIRSVTDPPGTPLRFDEPGLSQNRPLKNRPAAPSPPPVLNMDQAMKHHIESVLHLANGKIRGPNGAAELLGIPSSTLRNRMNKLGILYGRQAQKKI